MNARERFQRVMRFERPDRVPLWDVEGIAEGAVRRWIVDGDVPIGVSRGDIIPFDPCTLIKLDTDPIPAFVTRTVEEDDEWRTTVDRYGFTVRTSKTQSVGPTHYYYLDGPVHGRADWDAMKERFDPSDPRRKPRDWSAELIERLNRSAGPVGLRIDWGPGRGIKNGYMMGMERFLETVTGDPALLEAMFAFWADFVVAASRDWLANVRFDFAYVVEDGMGFKHSTLVSPAMYRRLWAPSVRRVVACLRGHGVEVIGYHTSGDVRPLIPALLEAGVNLVLPLESAAGMDARELRRAYGRELRLIGNIARQALMDGPEAVEREFRAKVPPLIESGGYLPAVDDMLMPDMPYASVRRYVELVREFKP